MTPSPLDLGVPPSVEGAQPSAGPDPSKHQDASQAHYRTSDEECFACEYFDGNSVCSKGVNGGTVEPGAGCDLFEIKDDGQGGPDADDQGGAPMPGQGAPQMPPQGGGQQ